MVLHANAALSVKKRLLLCERVVEREWTLTKAAETTDDPTARSATTRRQPASRS